VFEAVTVSSAVAAFGLPLPGQLRPRARQAPACLLSARRSRAAPRRPELRALAAQSRPRDDAGASLVAIAAVGCPAGSGTNAIIRKGAPSALRESSVAAACHVTGAEQESRDVRSSASSAGHGTLLDHAWSGSDAGGARLLLLCLLLRSSWLTADGNRHVGAAEVLHLRGGRAAVAVSVGVAGGVPKGQSRPARSLGRPDRCFETRRSCLVRAARTAPVRRRSACRWQFLG
jgi:hypothetical protein